jgi:molybdopterin/thiamine biosynthesis adenylyltransferase
LNRFHRQLGLVDQNQLSKLSILLSGDADSVADAVVMLEQLGAACKLPGKVGILVHGEDEISSVFWKLAYPRVESFEEFKKISDGTFILEDEEAVDLTAWDIHLSINSVVSTEKSIFGRNWGPRAAVSTNPIQSQFSDKGEHPLTPFSRVMVTSALVELMLDVLDLKPIVQASDSWVTITTRFETTDVEEAKKSVMGTDHIPISFKATEDGKALLGRLRIPMPEGINPFDYIHFERKKFHRSKGDTIRSVGLIEWNETSHCCDEILETPNQGFLILGAGGLGSWAAPLLAQSMKSGKIIVVDSDVSIDEHNLNRQVLYNIQDVGKSKATIAKQKLEGLNDRISVEGFVEELNLHHVREIEEESLDFEHEIFEDFDLDEGQTFESMTNNLNDCKVYLGCLDNMRARSILNNIALIKKVPMINGASESNYGVVEGFDQQGCMVCRYGKDAAHSMEIISCTEEGARPIASIVTTTAWTGAMMAAFAFLASSNIDVEELHRHLWNGGRCTTQVSGGKPPWYNENCLCHI